MKNNKKSAFTLVELIIVIAIIAILAVTAFLVLTKWIAKSRDSARLSDLNTIDNALQISLTESSSLPKPDNYTLIYASGTTNVVGYQGEFSDNTAKALGNLSKAPKDGLDNTYYNYYVNSDATQYQLLGFTENSIAYNPNAVNAVDYSTRYAKLAGDKLGILVDSLNTPVNKLGLTGIDIKNTTTTYKAYFDSSTTVSGTGASLVSMLTLNNKNLASLDTGLVFYSDMETTVNSGGLVMLKDLSKNGYNITCGKNFNRNGGNVLYTGYDCDSYIKNGINGKSFSFQNQIVAFSQKGIGFPITGSTYSLWFNSYNMEYQSTLLYFIGLYNSSINITNQYPAFRVDDGTYASGVSNININQWYNIIVTIDNVGIKRLYLNGNLLANGGNYTTTPYFSLLKLGARGLNTGSKYYNGLIDEVRIYNRALSDDEVKALYNAN